MGGDLLLAQAFLYVPPSICGGGGGGGWPAVKGTILQTREGGGFDRVSYGQNGGSLAWGQVMGGKKCHSAAPFSFPVLPLLSPLDLWSRFFASFPPPPPPRILSHEAAGTKPGQHPSPTSAQIGALLASLFLLLLLLLHRGEKKLATSKQVSRKRTKEDAIKKPEDL